MKSQEQREGDAVVIFTAMLWLAVATVIGWVVVWVAFRVTGLDDGLYNVAFWVVFAGAASVSLGYLYRHRRP